ncbi:MAG: hypothetical protein ACXWPM_06705 [Bdellovibrionota bacterium]
MLRTLPFGEALLDGSPRELLFVVLFLILGAIGMRQLYGVRSPHLPASAISLQPSGPAAAVR